jgi:exodeoxyribonuclease VII large subunit
MIPVTALQEKDLLNSEPSILTVEQLNLSVKSLLEAQFDLVWVQGEISNFKAHTSGHYYFSLKDKRSQVSAVMFRGYNSKLKFQVKDGLEVILRGRISVYEPRGSYQILCEMMEPVGAGALQKAFEQLKEKLKSEGLFDSARKKQLPAFPQTLAVVTSPTGAAIQDILNILGRRAPHVRVYVVPSLVQGPDAASALRSALALAEKIPHLDVIIIGRGGGSSEDMWCFNDEELARSIAKCPIPIISAVGHEIDFTICDFVSDLRAPTPSAAAELVAKSSIEVRRQIGELVRRASRATQQKLFTIKQSVKNLTSLLVDPKRKIEDLRLRNDDLISRLIFATDNCFSQKRLHVKVLHAQMVSPDILLAKLEQKNIFLSRRLQQNILQKISNCRHLLSSKMSLLDSLSPLRVVERGYSILTFKGEVLKSSSLLKPGDLLQATLAESRIELEYKQKLEDLAGHTTRRHHGL